MTLIYFGQFNFLQGDYKMKKFLLSLICVLLATVAAQAKDKHQNKGFVFVPENVVVETVADAKDKNDDTIVVMQGQIVKALGHDKYQFTDETGEIILDIDEDDFDGITVTEGELIEITGEIDKEMMKPTEVDVKKIKKLDKKAKKHMKNKK